MQKHYKTLECNRALATTAVIYDLPLKYKVLACSQALTLSL